MPVEDDLEAVLTGVRDDLVQDAEEFSPWRSAFLPLEKSMLLGTVPDLKMSSLYGMRRVL